MRFLITTLFILIAEIIFFSGCENENNNPALPEDKNDKSGLYGNGYFFFESTGVDSGIYATGSYKPSNEFANDTLSQGAGGFVTDTMLFGKKIISLITAYKHEMKNLILNEKIILIGLTDPSSIIQTGEYPFSRFNNISSSSCAYVYFILSDSTNFFQMFVPKSGKITISSYDANTRNIKGIFGGILCSMPPDTSREIQLINGKFDIYLANKYFNY